MNSMTGFGRGEATAAGFRFAVELHSVNRKHIDIALNLPRTLFVLEGRIRETLTASLSRGRINVTVTIHPTVDSSPQIVDWELATIYADSMRVLQQRLGIEGGLTLDSVLRAPGVLLVPGQDIDAEAAWPSLEKALQSALTALVKMRALEGAALAADLSTRLATLRECAASIATRAPEIAVQHRKQLLERLRNAQIELPVDDDRLLRELALFADRSDISEELTRLESHFVQMESLQKQKLPVGRPLEFLTQEIGRELNTLSVKSNDAPTSHWVVAEKAELEKIREQVQNIE